MRHKPILVALLAGLILWMPVQGIAFDEEQPKSHEKKQMRLENERMKKELQALKGKLQLLDNSDEKAGVHEKKSIKRGEFAHKIDMVQLPIGIRIGKYEVTQRQWLGVMGNNNQAKFQFGDNYPMEQVEWEDVMNFIQVLSIRTGKHYRLPTQEEWRLACQAGLNTEYCGSDDIDAVAWYESNSGGTTHAVGQKQPNAWGLYDMSGNVWEWVSGCQEGKCNIPEKRNVKSDVWLNSCLDRDCIFRRISSGGSWFDTPRGVRSVYRFRDSSGAKNSSLGFRLAEDL